MCVCVCVCVRACVRACVLLGHNVVLNIGDHFVTVPPFTSGTNALPHRNAMIQTHGITLHPVTVYIHWTNRSLCYPSILERHTGSQILTSRVCPDR